MMESPVTLLKKRLRLVAVLLILRNFYEHLFSGHLQEVASVDLEQFLGRFYVKVLNVILCKKHQKFIFKDPWK